MSRLHALDDELCVRKPDVMKRSVATGRVVDSSGAKRVPSVQAEEKGKIPIAVAESESQLEDDGQRSAWFWRLLPKPRSWSAELQCSIFQYQVRDSSKIDSLYTIVVLTPPSITLRMRRSSKSKRSSIPLARTSIPSITSIPTIPSISRTPSSRSPSRRIPISRQNPSSKLIRSPTLSPFVQ